MYLGNVQGDRNFQNPRKINPHMYMDYVKLFTMNEQELETLIQTIRIYSQDMGMEFGTEKCATLLIKNG